MGHGSTENCEPNFTPLLDLVLQLVMFFMICANFVMEQTAEEIKLPEAVSGKALDKDQAEVIFLNVNKEGKVILTPDQWEGDAKDKTQTLDNEVQVQRYMERAAKRELTKTGKKELEAALVLRVDESTPFDKTYRIMKACRQSGYKKVQLRVIKHSSMS